MRWHLKQPYHLNGSRCGEPRFGGGVSGNRQLNAIPLLLEESNSLLLRHALIQRYPINRQNLIILLQSSIPGDQTYPSVTMNINGLQQNAVDISRYSCIVNPTCKWRSKKFNRFFFFLVLFTIHTVVKQRYRNDFNSKTWYSGMRSAKDKKRLHAPSPNPNPPQKWSLMLLIRCYIIKNRQVFVKNRYFSHSKTKNNNYNYHIQILVFISLTVT